MSGEGPSQQAPAGGYFRLLERITAAVLLLVVASLGWILAAAYQPDLANWAEEAQVIIVLVLLTAALVLVSIVALLHTR